LTYFLSLWLNRPIPQDKRSAILNALNADKGFTQTMSDTYFGGKQLAAMARLVLIAEELGINYSHFPSFFSFI
jgi:hypothetical protein